MLGVKKRKHYWFLKFTGFSSPCLLWGMLRIRAQACPLDFLVVSNGLYLLRFARYIFTLLCDLCLL